MTTFVFLVSKFGGFGVNYWDLFLLLFLHIPGNCNYYLKRCDPACEADRNQETSYLLMNISQPNEAKRPSLWILPKGLLPNNNNKKKIIKKFIYIYISFCIVPQTIQQTFAMHRSAKKSCLVHKTAFWKLTSFFKKKLTKIFEYQLILINLFYSSVQLPILIPKTVSTCISS